MIQQAKGFGVNVWWSVPSMVLDGESVQGVLEKHGFERKDMPLPSRRTEVSRACYSFQNRRHQTKRRITEKTQDNGTYLVYGILDQSRKDSEHVGFRQTTTVYLNKDTGEVRVEGALSKEVIEAIHEYEGKVTEDDVRTFLREVIRMCFGVAKRPSGGIYFVPDRFANVMESAQSVLSEIGGDAKLYIEGIINGQQEREIVWESVESDVESEIDKALMAVDRIEKSAKAVTGQKAKLERMNEIVEVYKSLLGKEAHYEGLAERIEEAVHKVSVKIADIQKSSKPKPVVEPKRKRKKTKPRGSKIFEAVVDVLKKEDKPMHYRAIAHAMVQSGKYKGKAKSAADSVRRVIQLSVDGGDARVEAVGRGMYATAQ
jgi:hypothetical protein